MYCVMVEKELSSAGFGYHGLSKAERGAAETACNFSCKLCKTLKKERERMSRESGKTEENMHLEQKNWQNMSCYKLDSCFL